ncbi:MAG: periplasmic heavy metal sensor [Bdellovibrionales bacterium]
MTEERNKLCCTGGATATTIVSVALNLFLVGVLVGPMIGPRPQGSGMPPMSPAQYRMDQPQGRPEPMPREPGFMLGRVMRDLDKADADKLKAIFAQERKGFKDRHVEMAATMKKLADLLRQEKPDAAALQKVMVEIRGFGEGMHEGMNKAMIRVAAELSLEARKKIADAIEQGPEGRRDGMGHRGLKGGRGDRFEGPDHRGGPHARPCGEGPDDRMGPPDEAPPAP